MRICLICNEYPPAPHGGIGTFVKTLARSLAQLGHQVFAVGYGHDARKRQWEDGPVSVLTLPLAARWLEGCGNRYGRTLSFVAQKVHFSRALKALAAKAKFEVVESYDWSGPLWYHPGCPLVVRMHGANTAHNAYEGRTPSRLLKFAERRAVRIADRLVAVSGHIGTLTLRSLAMQHRSHSVIYNGVDTDLFRPLGAIRSLNEVLYVGTVSRRKGMEPLFQAMAQVFEERPSTVFRLAGSPPGDNTESKQEQLLALLPTRHRNQVQFLGRVPHERLPALYNQAAVAVFPSLSEAFSLTCVEAMATGCPVVMTSLGSGPEIVSDGNSGLLADPRSPKQLSQAILRLLNQPELRRTLSTHARERAVNRFSLRKLTADTLCAYRALTGNPQEEGMVKAV
jgi:glycosyltransferase involved in cell wall biosynthesis